jgi:hypothetical protein
MEKDERKFFIMKKRRKGLTEMNNKAVIKDFTDTELIISKMRRAGFSAIPYDRSENDDNV